MFDFDNLKAFENRIRRRLSRYPLAYAFLGGVGVVLFWRGVWYSTDFIAFAFSAGNGGAPVFDWKLGADSIISLIVGILLLLSTGLFVNELLGKEIIESEVEKEEQFAEKTKKEIGKEETDIERMEKEIHHIIKKVEEIDGEIHQKR